jgi:phosphatidylinositol glycan class W
MLKNKATLSFNSFINEEKSKKNSKKYEIANEVVKSSICLFRSSVFIITSVTIFAVEFKIYPKIHAKKKRFGISLLDMSVGLFIFCDSMRVFRSSKKIMDNYSINGYF